MTTPTFIWYGRAPSGADVEVHLNVNEIVLEVAGSTPANPVTRAPYPTELFDAFKRADAALKAAGFTRSERFDKPTYGGGGSKQKRPDTPPPPGIMVPQHCGEAMKYIRYKKDGAKGFPARGVAEGYADMWVCVKDKQCEDVTSGKSDRAHASFDMRPDTEAKPAESNGDRAMEAKEWVDFWTKVRAMGYDRPMVFETAADVLTGHGPSMTDVEFTKLGKIAVHKVFVALKEKHDAKEG